MSVLKIILIGPIYWPNFCLYFVFISCKIKSFKLSLTFTFLATLLKQPDLTFYNIHIYLDEPVKQFGLFL